MHFNLKRPCPKCPFRRDVTPYITHSRAVEIITAITTGDQTFMCHQTTRQDFDDDGDDDDERQYVPNGQEEHCAGALVMLEAIDRPNQMMRIAERIRLYDRRKLDIQSPVYDSFAAMKRAHKARKM